MTPKDGSFHSFWIALLWSGLRVEFSPLGEWDFHSFTFRVYMLLTETHQRLMLFIKMRRPFNLLDYFVTLLLYWLFHPLFPQSLLSPSLNCPPFLPSLSPDPFPYTFSQFHLTYSQPILTWKVFWINVVTKIHQICLLSLFYYIHFSEQNQSLSKIWPTLISKLVTLATRVKICRTQNISNPISTNLIL